MFIILYRKPHSEKCIIVGMLSLHTMNSEQITLFIVSENSFIFNPHFIEYLKIMNLSVVIKLHISPKYKSAQSGMFVELTATI